MKRMPKQYVRDRIVGKSGGTRLGNLFSKDVHEWSLKKDLLKAAGYRIEVGSVRDYQQYYLVYFPDGHREELRQVEAMNITI